MAIATAVWFSLAAAGAASGAEKRPGRSLQLIKTKIYDPHARCDALRLLLPAGWKADVRFDWTNNANDPCRVIVRAYNPGGAEALMLYPSLMFADGAREESARTLTQTGMPPAQANQRAARTYPEGSSYYGFEVRRMVSDPRSFAAQVLLPRYRSQVRDCKIIAVDNVPKLAEEALARDQIDARTGGAAPPKGITYTGTRLRTQYTLENRAIEEEIYYVVYVMPLTGLARHWGCRAPAMFRAERGSLDRVIPVLRAIQTSTKPASEWLAIVKQTSGRLLLATKQNRDLMIDQALRDAERQGALFDSLYRQYQQREAMRDRVQEKFIQTIRGVEAYDDPMQELPVELPTGYDRAWINERGDYFMTDKPFVEPHVGSSHHWREMRKLKPGEKK